MSLSEHEWKIHPAEMDMNIWYLPPRAPVSNARRFCLRRIQYPEVPFDHIRLPPAWGTREGRGAGAAYSFSQVVSRSVEHSLLRRIIEADGPTQI
jgi:hypothetical protein